MTNTAAMLTVEDLVAQAAWARRVAAALVGAGDSDDIVQETWLAALRAGPGTDRPLRRWLGDVLRNRALNRKRDEQRLRARHDAAAAEVEAPPSPEELLGRMEVQRLLAVAVLELREPLRQTILLRYFEDLKSPEIARAMGVPEGTVRRRIKDGLEEIKQRLDSEHGGQRHTWLRSLAPLSPVATVRRVSGFAKIVAGAAGLAAAGVVVIAAAKREPPTPVGSATLREPAARPPRSAPAAALVATGTASLEPCRQAVVALRAKIAEAESRRRLTLEDATLFAEGAANPGAQAALLPEIESIMRRFADTTFALECRTWNCRLSLIDPAGARPLAWEAIRSDPVVRSRIRGGSTVAAQPTKDAVSGLALQPYAIYMRLADPAVIYATPPATTAACFAEVERAKRRLRELVPPPPAEVRPAEVFAAGASNPAATARMKEIIAKALDGGDAAWAPEVECRGGACRVVVPGFMLGDTARGWRDRLFRDRDFRRHKMPMMDVGADGLFFSLFPDPERPLGDDLVRQVRDAWKASPALAGCGARYPAETGDLTATFELSDGVAPERGRAPGVLSIAWSGSLAETALARCVRDEATTVIGAARVPPRVRGASAKATLQFPLAR
jgi:RNA polymerase sigma-70 factor (ECF subfamily)